MNSFNFVEPFDMPLRAMDDRTTSSEEFVYYFFDLRTMDRFVPTSLRCTVANPRGELKAITTRSGLALDDLDFSYPPPFRYPRDEREEEIFNGPAQVQSPSRPMCYINFDATLVWKEVRITELISTQMTLELKNVILHTERNFKKIVFVPLENSHSPASFVSG
ncbi:hypothetical protein Tco_0133756 [Tanacetum coccineum]